MKDKNQNNISKMYLNNMNKFILDQANKNMNEVHMYIIISIAGRLHGIINTEIIKLMLFALQYTLIAQLTRFGVEDPIIENHQLSDNYRAWFVAWTNHFNNMSDELKTTIVDDFINKKDLTKYKYTGNWENYPRSKWMKMEFPDFLIPLLINDCPH